MKRNKTSQHKKYFDNKPRLPQSQHLSFSSWSRSPIRIFSFWFAIFYGFLGDILTIINSIFTLFHFQNIGATKNLGKEKYMLAYGFDVVLLDVAHFLNVSTHKGVQSYAFACVQCEWIKVCDG